MSKSKKRLSFFIVQAALLTFVCGQVVAAPTQQVSWGSLPNQQSSNRSNSVSNLENTTLAASDSQLEGEENTQTPLNTSEAQPGPFGQTPQTKVHEGPVINFNNVNITEFLRFVSRLTGQNFIFDPQELQFPVTIISETPTSLEDVMAALLQNLRIHEFYLIEEGGSFVIHKNSAIKAPGGLLHGDGSDGGVGPEIATQVFQVSNILPQRVATIVTAMTSKEAVIQVVDETTSLVVTDLLSNILKIADIIKKLDMPNSGLDIGQYVALSNSPAALLAVSERLILPLAGDKTFVLVPYVASNSIFIISTPFLVEKALAVLQALDLGQSISGAFNVDKMKFDADLAKKMLAEQQLREQKQRELSVPLGQEEIDALTDREKYAILQAKGYTADQLSKFSPEQIARILKEKGLSQLERERILGQKRGLFESELPLGQVESTQFLIYKLQYRKTADIAKALQAIAVSLSGGQTTTAAERKLQTQSDLTVTLNSVQTLEDNNSLVFTGTRATLQKVKELVSQIDVPVRQVMIEALVLDTTLTESLNFGVEWGVKLQRKNFSGQTGLISTTNSVIAGPLTAIGFAPTTPTSPPTTLSPVPLQPAISITGIGRKIKFNGTGLLGTAGVINLLRTDQNTKIKLNPKIVTEHNVPAEIFVGSQIPIKGQSIVNATSSGNIANTVATNYETQQVGTSLKVTPLISASDMVTLIIDLNLSNANQTQVNAQGANNAPPATVNQIRSTTRVHMPSDYFLMLSGLLSDQETRNIDQVPILGSLPIIGFLFSNKLLSDQKRNVIIYIRPKILDTTTDIEDMTQSEERNWKENTAASEGWRNVLNDARELLNFPE